MSKKFTPIAAALGTAFALSIATSPVAADSANPFGMSDLVSGYSVAMGDKPAEGKCGEGKKGEAKCGADKKAEGKCGGKKGEAKCGTDKKAEGKCGGDKKKTEAKCGEGKCGGSK